jgi:hypothetical protein
LEVNQLSVYHAKMMMDNIKAIDRFGLVVRNAEYLDSVGAFLYRNNMKYIFSEIDVDTLIQSEIFDNLYSFFITSWRDLHESNRLTFNGITDRKGRFKTEYFKLMDTLQDSEIVVDNAVIKILRPAALIYENKTYQYYAMINNDTNGWKHGVQVDGYKFEWSLVKCDKFGNFLAVKDAGIGPVLSLTIPQNHEYFKLLLTASNGISVTTTITSLNTPLIQKLENFNQVNPN